MRRFLCLLAVLWGSYTFASEEILQDRIGVHTFHVWDESRQRPINIEFWYPLTKEHVSEENDFHQHWVYPQECRNAEFPEELGKCPLILFSHGLGGDRRDRSWFAEKLVYEGYLVASIDHHKGTWGNVDPSEVLKLWERPQDVSFALDLLLEDPFWGKYIDTKKIGFSGYSLGGITGLLLAGAKLVEKDRFFDTLASLELPAFLLNKLMENVDFSQAQASFYDPRIQAYFFMAPCTWGIDRKSLESISKEMHIIALEKDSVLETPVHGQALLQQIPHASFTLLEGNADHYVFINRSTEEGKKTFPAWIHQDAEGVDREKLHEEVFVLGKYFFRNTLSQNN